MRAFLASARGPLLQGQSQQPIFEAGLNRNLEFKAKFVIE